MSGVRSDGTPSPEAACHEAAKQGAEGTGQAGTGPTDRGVLATSESPNRLRGRLTEHMISYVSDWNSLLLIENVRLRCGRVGLERSVLIAQHEHDCVHSWKHRED